jgi:hypothetical protein
LFAEDPTREPHEKETALHLEGDASHLSITSFKRVVYEKLFQRPEFQPRRIHVANDEGHWTVDSIRSIAHDKDSKIIGVTGRVPVGSLSVGVPRDSNSHARIVK